MTLGSWGSGATWLTLEARKLAWRLRRELHHMDARPNPAHLACVRLAEAGRLAGVITQNIDGLHTDAGLSAELVCEVHGTGRQFVCLACGERGPRGRPWPGSRLGRRTRPA